MEDLTIDLELSELPEEFHDLFSQRIDSLGSLGNSLPEEQLDSLLLVWALICQNVLPEVYGDSGYSRVKTKSMPGSRARKTAYQRRAALRQDIFKPTDFQLGDPLSD